MALSELQHLVRILEDRNVDLGRDDVSWAFTSAKTSRELEGWLQEYTSPATLLTREELNFHETHGNNTIPSKNDAPLISDRNFEAATASLEASTASIEKQSHLIQAQKHALRAIQAQNISSTNLQNLTRERVGKFNRGKGQADFDVADLSDSLQSRLQSFVKPMQNTTESFQAIAERSIEKDDRLLDGLEKVIHQITTADSKTTQVDEIDRLCQALANQSSADIHSQLDAAYRAASHRFVGSQNGNGFNDSKDESSFEQSNRQGDSLRAELEELCREIDGLSSMVVDNKYRVPISTALQTAGEDVETERATWAEYLPSALRYLTLRLDHMASHFDHIRGHSSALKTVMNFVDAATRIEDPKQVGKLAGSRSPSKPASQKGLKPLKLVQAKLSDPQDPVSQVLRQLDVQLSNVDDATAFFESLPDAVKRRQDKVKPFATNSERSCVDQITSSLLNADARPVVGAVYANSAFGSISLTKRELQNGLDILEEETQRLGNEMRELDTEDALRVVRQKQDALLGAFGGQ